MIRLDVTATEAGRPWALYVRADRGMFSPAGAGKPCSDLRWKLEGDSPRNYRAVDEQESVVIEQRAGGDLRITLNLAVGAGWNTPPGTYDLGLVFRVAYL